MTARQKFYRPGLLELLELEDKKDKFARFLKNWWQN